METKYLILFLFVSAVFSCKKEPGFSVSNKTDMARSDEVIVLTKDQLAEIIELKNDMLPVFKSKADGQIASQIDDLDKDGEWDEVAILLNFKAKETKSISIGFVAVDEYPVFEKRTNLRLGIRQKDGSYKEVDYYRALPCDDGFEVIAQAESVSWENDKIAFRNYFDCRNLKDLFGKLKPELIIDKVGTPELPSYHELTDWGMDVLHCGSSLGAGGIALLKNDSLYRLGSTMLYEYHKIVEGPIRSVFQLHYNGWDVDGELLEAMEVISVYPGKYWFESDVTVGRCPEGAQIVTGIVTSQLDCEPFEFEVADFQCIGTHGVQSLNKDELGMAAIVPLSEAGKIGRTTNINFFQLGDRTVPEKGFSNIISETYYVGQKCTDGVAAKHYFFSVWGLDKDQWKTEEGFRKYISEEAERLSNPIVVN